MVQTRLLPVAEWPTLAALPGPLFGVTITLDPDHARVVVVEDAQTIVGYWVAFNTVHAEPLWIAEEYRTNPAVGRGLLSAMMATLQECQVRYVFAIIGTQDLATTGALAERIGLTPIPGTLYGGALPEHKEG